ncbi:hypothetical protein F5Y06DRAFT_274832 [Hypoxylon sp. FL0890]|nr:hypothetical protein F5Y06DRAFT_274832 [Hypoxylon sp. FL0890]
MIRAVTLALGMGTDLQLLLSINWTRDAEILVSFHSRSAKSYSMQSNNSLVCSHRSSNPSSEVVSARTSSSCA